jgi:DnaK suppressor protein
LEQKDSLDKEDSFLDPSRTVGNTDIDTEADEQVFHLRMETFKSALERNLTQVRRALTAIRRGKYGKCDVCGIEIARARLRVFPTATLCTKCREEKEKEKGKLYRKRDILTSR